MATSSESAEARELSLVGKVELRIALADTDTKLKSVLNTYLAPLLLKLASEHISVRNKVISICQHINNRTKIQPIQLPVAVLIKQFKDNPNTALIRHFDLVYIQQGIGRLSKADRGALLPTILVGIFNAASSSAVHGATLFHLALRVLHDYELPTKASKENDNLREALGVSKEDVRFLSSWFGKLLLLKLGGSSGQGWAYCPGLSREEYSFLTLHGKPEAWDPSAESGLGLTDTKVLVLKLLASGLFSNEDRLFPCIFAAADTNSRLSEVGEDMLKRTLSSISIENDSIVEELYRIYFWQNDLSAATPGSEAPSDAVDSVSIWKQAVTFMPVRTRVLSLLARAAKSTQYPNLVNRVVQEGLAENQSTILGLENIPMQNFVLDPVTHLPRQHSSLTNRDLSKFRSQVVAFVHFVTRTASKSDLDAISIPSIAHLRAFIDRKEDEAQFFDGKSLRGQCFEVVGLLAGASRITFKSTDYENNKELAESNGHQINFSILTWLFDTLSEEAAKDVVVSIDEALSTILGSFQQASQVSHPIELEQLLLAKIQQKSKNDRNAHYAAVRFANRCLPYDNVAARWIDLVCLGRGSTESHETIEEARKGLDPHWYQLQNQARELYHGAKMGSLSFPTLRNLAKHVFVQDRDEILADQVRPFAVSYCRQVMIWEALKSEDSTLEITADWERKLDSAVSSDLKTRNQIKSYLLTSTKDMELQLAVEQLWDAALIGMTIGQNINKVDCARIFLEICTLGTSALTSKMAPRIRLLEPCIFSNDHALRKVAAQAYGILASHPACPVNLLDASSGYLSEKFSEWKNAVGAEANKVDGALLAVAYFLSRRKYRAPEDVTVKSAIGPFSSTLFKILEHATDTLIKEAAYISIGQLCLFSVLTTKMFNEDESLSKIVDKIAKQAKAGNEKAIATLGHLSIILDEHDDEEVLKKVTDELFSLHEIRQAETQFAVGEAICTLISGWSSSALSITFDIEGSLPASKGRNSTRPTVIDRALEACAAPKPALKKASVIWLLCFLQFCGDSSDVQERLPRFQVAFKRCLSDRDELVQESASRGLGLVYERGDRSLKDDLVRDLVASFSSNRAELSGTVTEDTQLFEPGALPTGDGSITTYKDIMSLASEVGDSSLVYRFMSLASNNAIWSSRAAFGRFGLSNVLSDSSVDGYLAANPKLYPKLYRYRFDPVTNVRKAMNDIWNALVKDSPAKIDANFEAIIEDLLTDIVSREWRVRQACCAAIADLIQGRELEKFDHYLDRIWTLCFKVLDDIKESVRSAAASLAKVLTNILLRSLEAKKGSSANAMLKSVLPFLLSTSGLESSAKEVQALSLHTLLEIIKKGDGQTLRPFIPELVERLLGLLSTFEHEAVNYVYLNASKYNLTEQKIDDMRLQSIRSSPLMDAIERCLDHLDESSMKELSTRLQSAMRSFVGMPSKMGCSRVIVSLSTRNNVIFQPHAGRFLKALQKSVMDRNETVSSAYAAAMGYVARGASDQQVLDLAAFAQHVYFEIAEDRARITSGDIVLAVAKHAADRFKALATSFLPFVFFARHDGNAQVKQVFQQAWEETVGGPRAASLYLKEILSLVSGQLGSARWILKHAAALSAAETVTAISTSQGTIDAATGEIIWPILVEAMAIKTWEGKEEVLEAFVVFVEKAHEFLAQRKGSRSEAVKIAVREARRRNRAYQRAALPGLARVAASLADADLVSIANQAAYEIAGPIIDEASAKPDAQQVDAMAVDAAADSTSSSSSNNNNNNKSNEDDALVAAAVECLLGAISVRAVAQPATSPPPQPHQQQQIQEQPQQTTPAPPQKGQTLLSLDEDKGRQLDGAAAAAAERQAGLQSALVAARLRAALPIVARANQGASSAIYAAVTAAVNNLLRRLLDAPAVLPALLSSLSGGGGADVDAAAAAADDDDGSGGSGGNGNVGAGASASGAAGSVAAGIVAGTGAGAADGDATDSGVAAGVASAATTAAGGAGAGAAKPPSALASLPSPSPLPSHSHAPSTPLPSPSPSPSASTLLSRAPHASPRSPDALQPVMLTLLFGPTQARSEALRLNRSEAILNYAKILAHGGRAPLAPDRSAFRAGLARYISSEKATAVRKNLHRANDLLRDPQAV